MLSTQLPQRLPRRGRYARSHAAGGCAKRAPSHGLRTVFSNLIAACSLLFLGSFLKRFYMIVKSHDIAGRKQACSGTDQGSSPGSDTTECIPASVCALSLSDSSCERGLIPPALPGGVWVSGHTCQVPGKNLRSEAGRNCCDHR